MSTKFEITGDNKNLLSALEGAREGVKRTAREIEQSGIGIEEMFKRVAAAAGVAFSIGQAKQFAKSVMDVRGQFQQLEIAFSTMLQSEDKAQKLMSQLVETAAKTPFDLKGVADGAKQLLAYGISANEVNETLTRLGDIAAGLSIPLGDLVYLYGTTMVQGRMFTMDLRQFMGRGIPMAEELAKQFGVAKDEVAGLVTAGKISSEAVKKAIWSMTEEGSKFGGLMAKQSLSITGQISNIEDAIDTMLNEIGKNNEDIINSGLDGVKYLIENYEKIGKILFQLIAIYGSYKAAVIGYTAIQKIHAYWLELEQTAHLQNALATDVEIAAKGRATVATVLFDKAQAALNKTMLANPYVLAATALMSVVSALLIFSNKTDEAAEANKKLNASFEETQAQIKSEQANIDILFDKLRKAKEGTNEYKTVKDQILGQYGKYLQGLSKEISTLKDVEGAYKAVAKAAREASIARGKEAALKDVQDTYGKNYASNLEKLQKALNDRVGNKQAASVLSTIQTELQKTGTISAKTEEKIKSLLRGTANYGNAGAWITGLKNNEKYLTDYTKLVEERFQVEEETTNKQEKQNVRNKKAIEDDKKNTQAELDALSAKDAAGKKGAALRKKIAGYDKELEAYSVKSDSKAASAAAKAAKEEKKEAKDAADRAAERIRLEWEIAEKTKEAQRAAREAVDEAYIAGIKDDYERERAQEEFEHKKRLADIERKGEEMKKARYEANKKQWELDNKDKHYETDSAEGRKGWQGVSLSGEELVSLNAELAKENAEYARAAKERAEALIASHQSYTDRKLAIDKQYSEDVKRIDAEIAAAQARGDNDSVAALQRSKRQAATDRAKNQSALSLDILKESPEYIRAFEDLEQTSSETLEYLIEEFEKAKQAAAQSLDPKDLKEYTDTIQRMQDEISSRNPFKTLKKSMDDLRKSEKDMKDAKKRLELVKQGVKVVKSYRKEGDKMVEVYYDEIEAQKEYNKSEDEYLKNRNKVKKAHKELQDEWSELGQQVQQLGDQIGGLAGECVSMIGSIMNFAVNISQTIDIVTTATAQGISAIEKASAILAIIQAAIQIVQAMASLLSGIFGDSDNGFAAAKEQYDNLSKVWDELIDKKRKYLNESWSNEAKQASKEAIELLKAEQAMNKIVAEARLGAGASAGSHSYGYRMWQGSYGYDGKNWQDVAGEISRELGVRFTGMSDMLNMSAEQLEWIKKNYTGLWANMDGEFQNALENIITFSTTEAEILEELKERITGSSLSDIYDNMMDSLYELANGSEDVMDDIAENWQEMINRMVVNNVVGTRVKEELKSWYEELYNLQDRYNDHQMTDSAYQQELERLRNSYNTIVSSSQQQIENFRQMGIIKTLEETAEEAKKYFEDILDSWKDTLTDMESTTEDWKNTLIDQIFSDLVESTILDAPLTVAEKTYENFEKYLQDWTERYKNTVEDATLSDEERTRRLKELIDEQTALREQQAEKSKQLAESIGKDMSEAISNSLDNLGDSLIEGLLANTEADAENAGKQIALTLIKEMLQTMLASEKYKGRMEEIRNKWQQLLNGEDMAFTMDDVLQDIANLNNDIANDESISALAQQYKELNKQVENTQTVFNDLHNTFLNTLTDMKDDAESFRKTLEQTMLKDFIDKQVLDVPITVNGMDFDDFNAYVEDWNKRYAEGVKEGNMEAVDALLDELMQVRELTLSQAEDLRKRLEDSMHELGSGFNNLREQFIKTLTNIVGDAESLGKEIGQSMMEQMLNAFVEKQYSDRINAVNEEWAKALEEGDPQRIDEIRQKVINLYETISSDRVVKQLSDDIKALTDTGTTPFDNLRSSYLAALTDMNKSTEDFTKEISQMIAQSFVDSFVLGDMFDDRIEAWKKKYKDITTDAGLSEEERMKQLRGLSEMIAAERESMQGQVSDIYKLLGINDHQDQEATMSLAEAATYDQFELYLGIATAQQIALEQGNVVRQQILSTLQTMGQITSPTNPTLLEMRNMFSTANEYLLDIKRSNREILDSFSIKIDSIIGKLKRL